MEKDPKDLEQEELEEETTDEELEDETTDDDFINSLLKDDDDEDDQDDEEDEEAKKSRKNKDAEEARKRREAEAKAKKEAELKAKKETERKAKEEAERKAKEEAEAKAKVEAEESEKQRRSANENKLGEQLVAFKTKYPDIDLGQLDKDKHFKNYIDGKLLGKKDITTLYEEYVDFRSGVSGTPKDIIEKNFRKAQSSSGTSQKGGGEDLSDVYSIDELKRLSEKLPFMSRQEAAKVEAKYERSLAYYEKN